MNKGATLTELLVALAILAFCLIPIMQIIPSGGGLLSTARTENLNKALNLAIREIDDAKKRLQNIFSATIGVSGALHPADNSFRYTVINSFATADGGDPGPPVRLRVVRVTVWRDLDGNITRDALEQDYVELNTKVCSRETNF